MTDLDALLRAAKEATPAERIDLRDAIAAHGAGGIDAVSAWLADEDLWRLAVRVIGKAADYGARDEAVTALRRAARAASPIQRLEIDAELRRFGRPGLETTGAFGPADRAAIRDRLVAAARRGDLTTYKALAEATGRSTKGPHWAVHIGRILGEISTEEVAHGRPMLTAIVVSQGTKLPGGGFFNLGEGMRLVRDGEDEEAFARRQIREVHDYYRGERTR